MDRLSFVVDMNHASAYDSSVSSVVDAHDPDIHIVMPSSHARLFAGMIRAFLKSDEGNAMISTSIDGGSLTIMRVPGSTMGLYTIRLQDNDWLNDEQGREPKREYHLTKYGLGMLANSLTVSANLSWDDASCRIRGERHGSPYYSSGVPITGCPGKP